MSDTRKYFCTECGSSSLHAVGWVDMNDPSSGHSGKDDIVNNVNDKVYDSDGGVVCDQCGAYGECFEYREPVMVKVAYCPICNESEMVQELFWVNANRKKDCSFIDCEQNPYDWVLPSHDCDDQYTCTGCSGELITPVFKQEEQ